MERAAGVTDQGACDAASNENFVFLVFTDNPENISVVIRNFVFTAVLNQVAIVAGTRLPFHSRLRVGDLVWSLQTRHGGRVDDCRIALRKPDVRLIIQGRQISSLLDGGGWLYLAINASLILLSKRIRGCVFGANLIVT